MAARGNGHRNVLAEAQRALHAKVCPPNVHVMNRQDCAVPVALLVTFNRKQGDLILPLREGCNVIGRGTAGASSYGLWPLPYAVEQGQWFIECRARAAEVWDAASTNLSVLIPAEIVSRLDLGDGTSGFKPLFDATGVICLPHPNAPNEKYRYSLHEGDVLRGYYASFIFGWL